MKKKKRKFIKERKTIKKLVILASLLLLVLVHFLIFGALTGRPLNFSYASTAINFSQSIKPIDPVEDAPAIQETKADMKDYKTDEFRILSEVGKPAEAEKVQFVAKSPYINFRGKSIYPNADIFLEIHSISFVVSVKSDDQGNWSWTNYGQPLEPGEHSIEAYSVSPYNLSGKQDIFAEKYYFIVNSITENTNPDLIFLDKSNYVETLGDGDLGDRLMTGKVSDVYIFDAMLLGNREYSQGDELMLQMIFNPLGKNFSGKVDINYDMSYYGETETKPQPISHLEDDQVSLNEGGSFLKKIVLKNDIMPGGYFLKVSTEIGGTQYVQTLKFNVDSKVLVQVGNMKVTTEKLQGVLVWDIVIILAVAIVVTFILIMEFRRYMVYGSVDERILKKKGYITK